MRVGILTQPLDSNYGGILQNYALQVTLKRLGHNPLTLRTGRVSLRAWLVGYIKNLIKRCIGRYSILKPLPWLHERRRRGIERFIESNIAVTEKISWYRGDLVTRYHLQALLVGSDKTWAPYFSKIEDMFFDFAKAFDIPKVSYAASFGTDVWQFDEDKTAKLKELVMLFSGVSVREFSGVRLCKDYLCVDAQWVLDPTLLLDASDYNLLCSHIEKRDKRFLFAYILDWTKEKEDFILELGHKFGLEIVVKRAEVNVHKEDTIEDWLAMYRDCSFVVTDSFHGTIFALLYHKNFYSLINPRRGKSRFSSLSKLFSLDTAIVDTDKMIAKAPKIDWSQIDRTISIQRELSLKFLSDSLTEC